MTSEITTGAHDLSLQKAKDMSLMVNNAVDHLIELACKFKESEISTLCIDDEVVKGITSSFLDLDSERLNCHEELEIETITASNLRHKLALFPREIEAEIRGAVSSARESNQAEIQKLQARLAEINNSISEMDKKHQMIVVENLGLEPQKDKMETDYEQTISLLNQSLADKASLLIKLNETRKKLKETYEEIADVDKALAELGEEMVDEREEARLEKGRLELAVAETSRMLEEQQKVVIIKDREIEEVRNKLTECEMMMNESHKKLRHFEQSIERLEAQNSRLSSHLQKEIIQNTKLTKEGMLIVEERASMMKGLSEEADKLRGKHEEIKEEASKTTKEFDRLHAERIKLLNELDVAKASGSKGRDEALEVERKLRRVKDDLAHGTRECVRLNQENEELETDIEQRKQEHQATLEILNKQLNDIGSALAAERRERLELQSRRDSLTKESNEYKGDYSKLMLDMNTKIAEGKAEHKRLTDTGAELQTNLKQDELDIKTKQKILQQGKLKFVEMQKRLKSEIKQTQENIENLENQIAESKEKIKVEKPRFEEFEEFFNEKTREFENMKKRIVEMKNKKASLETSVDRIQSEIEKAEHPIPGLREELKNVKATYFQQLENQTQQTKLKEREIFLVEEKLAHLQNENAKFSKAIDKLQQEHQELTARIKNIVGGKGKLESKILHLKGLIEEKWREDMKLDKEYYHRDLLLLDDIQQIQEFTQSRESRIQEIFKGLDEELGLLSSFIDMVAGQRSSDATKTYGVNKIVKL